MCIVSVTSKGTTSIYSHPSELNPLLLAQHLHRLQAPGHPSPQVPASQSPEVVLVLRSIALSVKKKAVAMLRKPCHFGERLKEGYLSV